MLTGDTILGRGTTVIAQPDGSLGDYLDSLRTLAGLGPRFVLPAHGPQLPDLQQVAGRYLEHREERLAQIRSALDALGADASVAAVTDAGLRRHRPIGAVRRGILGGGAVGVPAVARPLIAVTAAAPASVWTGAAA